MTSCSSSASVMKSMKSEEHRSISCDTACTSNSSCYLRKRKPMNPLVYSVRPNYTKTSGNSVRQRVLSAKLLKLRSIQNQLNDANYHLSELSRENQTLKNLQKRQDKALSKYENTNADLPRLIHSHEEQIRILSERNKSQRKAIKELNDVLKVKEDELAKALDKLSHLEKLNRDKRLLDREKLVDQIEDLKLKLQKSDEQNSILNRKLILEVKTSKQRMNAELMKYKQCQKELRQALSEIDRLTGLLEIRENVVQPRKNRFSRMVQRQSVSMITLGGFPHSSDKLSTIEDLENTPIKTPVTDVKLEPIKVSRPEDSCLKKSDSILSIPSESIKNRLSSGSVRARSGGSGDSIFSESSEVSCNNLENSSGSSGIEKSRPNSTTPLDKLDAAIQRATDNTTEEFDRKLADYCSDVLSNVRQSSERIDVHKESLQMSRTDTDTLMETFKKTQNLETKLKNSLLTFDDDSGVDIINEILGEEKKFESKDRNGNVAKASRVRSGERRKLLATLKAIDNGDSVESLSQSPEHSASSQRRLSKGVKL